MQKHHHRLLLILVATVAVIVALIASVKLEATSEIVTALCGALGVLVPALLDAAGVEKRRRTPGQRAIADDVTPESGSQHESRD